jgi:IPT/TIG domain
VRVEATPKRDFHSGLQPCRWVDPSHWRDFYERAGRGGSAGTVFSLAVGLGPFVETLPTSGKVGKAIKILGTNLTGATSVTFNGTAATFTVVSSSEIKTTVLKGATTSKVKVTTPSCGHNWD